MDEDDTILAFLETTGRYITSLSGRCSDRLHDVVKTINISRDVRHAFDTGRVSLEKSAASRRGNTIDRTKFFTQLYTKFSEDTVNDIDGLDPRAISFLAECIDPFKLSKDKAYRTIVLQTCEQYITRHPTILDLVVEVRIVSDLARAVLSETSTRFKNYLQRAYILLFAFCLTYIS